MKRVPPVEPEDGTDIHPRTKSEHDHEDVEASDLGIEEENWPEEWWSLTMLDNAPMLATTVATAPKAKRGADSDLTRASADAPQPLVKHLPQEHSAKFTELLDAVTIIKTVMEPKLDCLIIDVGLL
ncbi:hypothetical protein NDU88_001272 [Pleurodeles waltl]|uniref:Uncharacterized protein n=1 Tax=Pleurodeles waltl TaxID=8319 RepID=A0AAV7THB4_PLEWA|nr:hypothetical protein NDU88_001272 [Pleurodeles waltl]